MNIGPAEFATDPLPRKFFARDTHLVANELLGKWLIRSWRGKLLIGRITEVESYVGEDDNACHAARGRTPRTEVMFGHAYVYLIYGIYHCLNVVTDRVDFPAAVLIRAVEPLAGIPTMSRARGTEKLENLTTGPGKLTQALRITRNLNGEDLTTGGRLWIAESPDSEPAGQITAGPRVGVDYAGEDASLPWRYFLTCSHFVSKRVRRDFAPGDPSARVK